MDSSAAHGKGASAAAADETSTTTECSSTNLESLEPVTFLSEHTSDYVRNRLAAERMSMMDAAAVPKNDESFTAADFLDSPFFAIKNQRLLTQVQASTGSRGLSANVSTTARDVLNKFYGYDVSFQEWVDTGFEQRIGDVDITSLGHLPPQMKNWGRMLRRHLALTEMFDMGGTKGKVQELTVLHCSLRGTFSAFGFDMKLKDDSSDDVTCSTGSPSVDFMFMEGKEADFLQQLPQDGHRLCLIGFATRLARVKWEPPVAAASSGTSPPTWQGSAEENNANRMALQDWLHVSAKEPPEFTSVPPSEKTNKIFRSYATELAEAKTTVDGHLAAGRIEPHDAVSLWAAVMQACHHSIKEGRRLTIIMSARLFWFLEFHAHENGACEIRISTARKVGSQGFLTTVVKFLHHASVLDTIAPSERRRWERALDSSYTRTRRATTNNLESGSQRKSNKRPHAAIAESTTTTCGEQASCESTAIASAASFEDTEAASYFSYDDFGVAIPWFDQIGDTLQVLGRGRTGEVTKVVWNSQHVALKTFILQCEDDRRLQDVYEHELGVLRSLRKLWGEHVPALLFHKPWQTSPMIGLELGEQLPDDMSLWSPEDQQKASETMERIEELGWRQGDVRGANFVRLKGRGGQDGADRIAMIDFESMERVAPERSRACY